MTKENVNKLQHGVYRIFWKDDQDGSPGGSSVASVGRAKNGDVWMCPANWTSGSTTKRAIWKSVKEIVLIKLNRI